MTNLYNPRWRLRWAVGMAGGVAAFVGLDYFLRATGGRSPLAPTHAALWLSVAAGAALGVLAMLHERYLMTRRRATLLAFHRAPLRERLSWRVQKTNLWLNGWLIAALVALVGVCYFRGVFVLPAIFATNVAQFAGNRELAARFDDELRQAAAA